MRTVIKITCSAVALVLAVGTAAPSARADSGAASRTETSYYTTRDVLAQFFPHSEHVGYRTFALDKSMRARLAQRLGYAPARDKYTIFVATTHGQIDGYAVVDDEQGLHQPITFATRLSPRGMVERVEIMVYREPRGDEVRDPRFRKQFQGKTSQDPLRLNHDIDAVSGATVSSASLAVGVRRATILVEELALGLSTLASAPAAPPAGDHAARPAPVSR
ncbi:MAG TPA: FMN-binding protein [Polyangia bacterium]|nr:FMN-binding protein [Polyangia bacterium]